MKQKELEYFDGDIIFKNDMYHPKYKTQIVLVEKNTGKSTWYIHNIAQKRFIEHKERFLIIRRTQDEVKRYTQSFSNGFLWPEGWSNRGNVFFYNKEVAGYIINVSGNNSTRSINIENCKNVIFDEFQGHKGDKPIPFFMSKYFLILSNFVRKNKKDARIYLLGNNNDARGEILNTWEIDTKRGGVRKIPELGVILYNYGKNSKYVINPDDKDDTGTIFQPMKKSLEIFHHFQDNSSMDVNWLKVNRGTFEIEYIKCGFMFEGIYFNWNKTDKIYDVITMTNTPSNLVKYYIFNITEKAENDNTHIYREGEEHARGILRKIESKRLKFTDMRCYGWLIRGIKSYITLRNYHEREEKIKIIRSTGEV